MSDHSDAPEPDLVDRLLSRLDHLLDVVHDRVLRPIIMAARFLAFGVILLLVAILVIAVVVIGFIRLLNVYAFSGRDWLSYAVVGTASLATGLVIWRRRRPIKLRK